MHNFSTEPRLLLRLAAVALSLVAAPPAVAGASAAPAVPIGFADGVSAAGVAGWACVPGVAAIVSVAAVAGNRLLGVTPAVGSRPDVAALCGTSAAGFTLPFDRATQAALAGEPSLALYALAPGAWPVPLEGSNPAAGLPHALPAGALDSVGGGRVLGHVAGAKPPALTVTAGAPAADGGVVANGGFMVAAPGGWRFAVPVPSVMPPAGAVLPLFGYAADAEGAYAPLGGALVPGATDVPIAATVAQTAATAGIRNTLFTAWLPAGSGFAGVSGQVSLAGGAPGFSEALVVLGTTRDGQAACAAQNGAMVSGPPPVLRLWAGILKNTGPSSVSIPVAVALPYPVPPPGPAGTCLMLWASAGYAYLTAAGMTTTLTAALHIAAAPIAAGAPTVIPLGVGGEFRFPVGTPQPLSVYVGLMAIRPLVVDAIAGAVSAAPVTNGPAGSGWQPTPGGNWSVGTSWLYLPAAACAAAHLQQQPGNGTFAILRQGTPALAAPPAGSRQIMRAAVASLGGLPIQKSSYQAFTNTAAGRMSLALSPGDCLVGWEATAPMAGGTPGMLDWEDQSTVYLRIAG